VECGKRCGALALYTNDHNHWKLIAFCENRNWLCLNMSVRRVPNGFSDKPNKFIIELLCGCAYLFDVIDMIDMIDMFFNMIDMFFNMIDTYN